MHVVVGRTVGAAGPAVRAAMVPAAAVLPAAAVELLSWVQLAAVVFRLPGRWGGGG